MMPFVVQYYTNAVLLTGRMMNLLLEIGIIEPENWGMRPDQIEIHGIIHEALTKICQGF